VATVRTGCAEQAYVQALQLKLKGLQLNDAALRVCQTMRYEMTKPISLLFGPRFRRVNELSDFRQAETQRLSAVQELQTTDSSRRIDSVAAFAAHRGLEQAGVLVVPQGGRRGPDQLRQLPDLKAVLTHEPTLHLQVGLKVKS
jgi:hypothetical protein